MAKEGRPSKYNPNFCEQAKKLATYGLIDRELAEFFGVSEQTLNAWKEAYPEFLEALKSGKEISDAKVVQSLFHRACGYEHPEDKIFYDSKTGAEVIVPTIKHYPPDTVACIYWLNNRQKDVWRNRQEVDLTSKGEKIAILDELKAIFADKESK